MDYKVHPLAITQVSWRTFIEVFQEILGYSPTRGLDEQGMSVEKPSSYLACLGLDNNPLRNLRNGLYINSSFEQVNMSFIIKGDVKLLNQITKLDSLHVVHRYKDDDFLIIVSGNMIDWRFAIVRACNKLRRKEIRWVFNVIYALMKDSGFGEVWHCYRAQELHDGTFELVSR